MMASTKHPAPTIRKYIVASFLKASDTPKTSTIHLAPIPIDKENTSPRIRFKTKANCRAWKATPFLPAPIY